MRIIVRLTHNKIYHRDAIFTYVKNAEIYMNYAQGRILQNSYTEFCIENGFSIKDLDIGTLLDYGANPIANSQMYLLHDRPTGIYLESPTEPQYKTAHKKRN